MKELQIICKLVRMSVFGTEEDIPTGVNWPKVFADAGVNGVSAICYEAVRRLPADRHPDLRESGDVDFVALSGLDSPAGFAACNAFAESLGLELKSQEKHSSFEYSGGQSDSHIFSLPKVTAL